VRSVDVDGGKAVELDRRLADRPSDDMDE